MICHPRQLRLFLIACWAGLAAIGIDGSTLGAAERVTVFVSSGRTFSGQVDRRTNDVSLWLRTGGDSSELLRPIDWYAVRSVKAGGRQFSTAEFRDEIEQWKSTGVHDDRLKTDSERTPTQKVAISESLPVPLPVIPERARSVKIDARIANWDDGVEMDGLLISVYPIDGQGQVVPVDGTLEVELIGEGPGSVVQRQVFPLLGRWVRKVSHDEIGPQGNVYQLPFQAIHPEFDLKYGAVGLVHARLIVPGQGAFETTSDATTLRPYNPVRDRLQSIQDERFFPNERTGRGKRQVPQMGGI